MNAMYYVSIITMQQRNEAAMIKAMMTAAGLALVALNWAACWELFAHVTAALRLAGSM